MRIGEMVIHASTGIVGEVSQIRGNVVTVKFDLKQGINLVRIFVPIVRTHLWTLDDVMAREG